MLKSSTTAEHIQQHLDSYSKPYALNILYAITLCKSSCTNANCWNCFQMHRIFHTFTFKCSTFRFIWFGFLGGYHPKRISTHLENCAWCLPYRHQSAGRKYRSSEGWQFHWRRNDKSERSRMQIPIETLQQIIIVRGWCN